MAEAFFGEGSKHRKYHSATHTASGRRHKNAGDGFWDDFKSGFKTVFDPLGKPLLGVLPGGNLVKSGLEAVGLGRPRRRLHSRLSHHELGFSSGAGGDLADEEYFEGDGKGMLRPAYEGAEGSGGRRKHRGEGSHSGGAHSGGAHRKHRGHADAEGEGKRKPSARNILVRKLMKEHGMSLPEASRYIKEHQLI